MAEMKRGERWNKRWREDEGILKKRQQIALKRRDEVHGWGSEAKADGGSRKITQQEP